MTVGSEFKFNYNFITRKLTPVCNIQCTFKRYYCKKVPPLML